jgi:hypothetical protein
MLDVATRNLAGLMGPEHVKDLESKAESADVAAIAATIATDLPKATELHKTFVASGAITAGQFVALRSDGKVEVVTGTETLAALGADNTQLSVSTDFRVYGASYNATSGKLAIIYLDQVVPRTLYVVVGTVSNGTITFGTPVTVDSNSNPLTHGDVCWNAAGTSIIVTWPNASSVVSLKVGTISGTTITLGATATSATFTSPAGIKIFHDDTHGSRVILYLAETQPANGRVVAATYSGTTFSVGSPVIIGPSTTFAQTDFFYDGANARFIAVGTNGSSTTVARCGTVSGTTFTVGVEQSKSGVRWALAFEPSSGKVVVFTTPSTAIAVLQATVVTFSGTVTTFNTSVSVSASAMRMPTGTKAVAVHNSSSGKIAVVYSPQVGASSAEAGGYVVQLGTVSGTTISFTAQTPWLSEGVNPNGTSFMELYSHPSTGDIAMTYVDANDYNRFHVATGLISGSTFTAKEDVLVRSAVPTYNALAGNGAQQLQAGWSLIDLGNWNPTSGTATTLTAFNFIFPTETTNADDWIGVAKASIVDGESVEVALRGGLDKQRSGLTPKTRYFLKGDGTLIANDNGRPAGYAISATDLLMEAA